MNLNLITLGPITKENWEECVALSVAPSQKALVGANARSLAEAYVRPESTPLGIFFKGKMVGFIMYLKSNQDGYYYIHRLMVDEKYQRKGIAKRALELVIDTISSLTDCKNKIYIMFLTHNFGAEKLYSNMGFKDTGEVIKDEKLFFYPLGDHHEE